MKNTDYLISENYVSVTAGNGFRLFPFGVLYKNGVKRDITPEFAKTVKLPHFKPPIKLSSHDDNTPAGGFITGLEVREDGLYAIPEWNEAGLKALNDGAYRYNSPEIAWYGGIEDPQTGFVMNDPTILGTALLHTPHLGEATALYSVDITRGETQMEENISVPKSLWDTFMSKIAPKEPEVKTVIPEDYEATKIERDEYKAKLDAQARDLERKGRIEKYNTEIAETKADPALSELLADLPEEKAGQIMRQFKALSEQIKDSNLTEEKGTAGAVGSGDPKAEFNAAVLAIAAESKLVYTAAFEQAKVKHADLFKSAFPK